jgi:hypothetical protein
MQTLKLNDVELSKPLGLDADGRTLTHADIVERKAPTVALASLDFGARKKLVLQRNEMENDFEIEMLGGSRIDRRQLMKEIEAESELGKWYVQAEISYLMDLNAKLEGQFSGGGILPSKFTPAVDPNKYTWVPDKYSKYILRRKAVFTESDHDTITTSGSDYRKASVHPQFLAKGFSIVSLTGSTNVRSTFEAAIKNTWVTYTSGIGHGSPTIYSGNAGSYLWQVGGYDASEPKGKVIHLLSCLTAQTLGPDLVTNGAKAYFGYHPSFYINWSYPDVFWACDSAIDHGFSIGMTAAEVHHLAYYVYNTMITTMTGIHSPTATTLTGDRDGLRTPVSGSSYGDQNANISAYPFITKMEAEMAEFEKEAQVEETSIDLEKLVASLTRVR